MGVARRVIDLSPRQMREGLYERLDLSLKFLVAVFGTTSSEFEQLGGMSSHSRR